MATKIDTLSGPEIVELSRRHTIYEWSAQGAVEYGLVGKIVNSADEIV